jgi:hypothetical protein
LSWWGLGSLLVVGATFGKGRVKKTHSEIPSLADSMQLIRSNSSLIQDLSQLVSFQTCLQKQFTQDSQNGRVGKKKGNNNGNHLRIV